MNRAAASTSDVRLLTEWSQLRRRTLYLSVIAIICTVFVVAVIYTMRHRARDESLVAASRKTCSAGANTVVLSQGDFGPPSMSGELIGNPWNQWQIGPHDLPEDNVAINVVVYRGIDLEEVKRQYPVVRGKSDYRYVEYSRAIEFIEKNIKASESYKDGDWDSSVIKEWAEMGQRLENARSVIIQNLGG